MVHTGAVSSEQPNVEWIWSDGEAEMLRAVPHGISSIAWQWWHMARVEDGCVAPVVLGAPPLMDEAWAERLGVDLRPQDGEGMSKTQVAALTAEIDLEGLRAYRDAVGARTRELVATLAPEAWSAPLEKRQLETAAAMGGTGGEPATWLEGKPRDGLLYWWGLHHSHYHIGQAALLRSLARST